VPRYAALLRAVNVGGRNARKEQLITLFEQAGAAGCATILASGNVVFTHAGRSRPALEARLARDLAAGLGFDVAVFLRTPDELRAVLAHEAFPPDRLAAAAALNVVFLKEPLDADRRGRLGALRTATDDFHVHGREIWWLSRVRQSESKISNAVLERALGVEATIRGLGTVEKVVAKLG
jgi:uncharacterized protein (DUF1697 family)